jgi:chromate reductase
MRILGISGSLRPGSHNTALVRAAADLLPPGAELVVFGGLREVPPYDELRDATDPGPAVRALRDAITGADALLIATPEYNASIPGVLKNAVDWASTPFPNGVLRRKPVLVVGASTGLFGAVWAQAELRKVLGTAGAAPLDRELPVGQADGVFTAGGSLADPDLAAALREAVDELVAVAKAAGEQAAAAA